MVHVMSQEMGHATSCPGMMRERAVLIRITLPLSKLISLSLVTADLTLKRTSKALVSSIPVKTHHWSESCASSVPTPVPRWPSLTNQHQCNDHLNRGRVWAVEIAWPSAAGQFALHICVPESWDGKVLLAFDVHAGFELPLSVPIVKYIHSRGPWSALARFSEGPATQPATQPWRRPRFSEDMCRSLNLLAFLDLKRQGTFVSCMRSFHGPRPSF